MVILPSFFQTVHLTAALIFTSYYSIGIRFSHIFLLEMGPFIKIVKSKTICSYHPMKLVSFIESAQDFDIDFQFTECMCLHSGYYHRRQCLL